MKSWYVEYLIMNRFEIASNPEADLDVYGDLLTVLKAVKYLLDNSILTKNEVEILESVPSLRSASKILHLSINTTFKRFSQACNKIGNYLGSYFTDAGYISELQIHYNLSDKQIGIIKSFMNSGYKFRIMRKQYNA